MIGGGSRRGLRSTWPGFVLFSIIDFMMKMMITRRRNDKSREDFIPGGFHYRPLQES